MGITKQGQELVTRVMGERSGNDYSVCELGDQYLTHGEWDGRLARDWYTMLGASRYECIEGNGNGTVTHDLNDPFPDKWCETRFHSRFDLVTDFGTGEHVFDQRQVWTTIHNLCRPGGRIIFERPHDGYYGHGFYLLCPHLIFDLAYANYWTILDMDYAQHARGRSLYGLLRMPKKKQPFKVPQQGRYHKDLGPILDDNDRGPVHKNKQFNFIRARFKYDER